MAHEAFISRNFSAGSRAIIDQANDIIADYLRQGFTLTLRQLYYQFVARDLLPNKMSEYKRLGSIINDARMAGEIDWDMIEDRTRNVKGGDAAETTPEDALRGLADYYSEPLWKGQEYRVIVGIEKDALVGVIERPCWRWRVPYIACRGYLSQSEAYSMGKRFEDLRAEGVTPIFLHLGDHDPSGIDMTRDNDDRFAMFAGERVEVRRLALNYDQVEQYDPPPNPAKETDSRSTGYKARFGDSSWELDALSPAVIAELVENAITDYIDLDQWNAAKAGQTENRKTLKVIADRWDDVQEFLRDDIAGADPYEDD